MQPLFKWIGGKRWLNKKLIEKSIQDASIYIEPFCGGLGSFFAIYPNLKAKKIILNDINKNIINLYKEVLNQPDILKQNYLNLETELKQTNFKKELYLEKRKEFNIKQSSELFLFIMRHCFNGIYRENNKGIFNTPFGSENVNIEEQLLRIDNLHNFFSNNNIEFHNQDVFELINKFNGKDTFIYLDPPYFNNGLVENKYNKNHFRIIEQEKLLKEILKFKYILYSNHNDNIFIDFFTQNNFNYEISSNQNVITGTEL